MLGCGDDKLGGDLDLAQNGGVQSTMNVPGSQAGFKHRKLEKYEVQWFASVRINFVGRR